MILRAKAFHLPVLHVVPSTGGQREWQSTPESIKELASRWQEFGAAYTYLNPRRLPLNNDEQYADLFFRTADQLAVTLARTTRRKFPLVYGEKTLLDRFGGVVTRPHTDGALLGAFLYLPKCGIEFVSRRSLGSKPRIIHPYYNYRRGGFRLTPITSQPATRVVKIDIPLAARRYTMVFVNGERYFHEGLPPFVMRQNPATGIAEWVNIKALLSYEQWTSSHIASYQRGVYPRFYGSARSVSRNSG